jgi:hypothetical protein
MMVPLLRCRFGRKSLFARSNQFALDFVSSFSYTYKALLPRLGAYGGGVNKVVWRRSL